MNFEELYRKYKEGTATTEEAATVLCEIEKARRVSEILDGEKAVCADVITEADAQTVRRAKKAFHWRNTVRTVIVCVICIAVLGALACGAVFGTALVSANRAKNVSEEEAIEAAKAALATHVEGSSTTEMIVSESELELDMGTRLVDTVYVYEITLILGDYKYELDVSAKTGYAVISDKEAVRSHDPSKDEEREKEAPSHTQKSN